MCWSGALRNGPGQRASGAPGWTHVRLAESGWPDPPLRPTTLDTSPATPRTRDDSSRTRRRLEVPDRYDALTPDAPLPVVEHVVHPVVVAYRQVERHFNLGAGWRHISNVDSSYPDRTEGHSQLPLPGDFGRRRVLRGDVIRRLALRTQCTLHTAESTIQRRSGVCLGCLPQPCDTARRRYGVRRAAGGTDRADRADAQPPPEPPHRLIIARCWNCAMTSPRRAGARSAGAVTVSQGSPDRHPGTPSATLWT